MKGHSFLWYWSLETSGNRSEVLWMFRYKVLEKDSGPILWEMKKYYVDSKGERNILLIAIVRCDVTVVLVEYIVEEI